jgi:transposase
MQEPDARDVADEAGTLAAGGKEALLKRGDRLGPLKCVSSTPRQVAVRARDLHGLLAQIAQAKRRFGLAADAPVHCVYEARHDGCWLHQFLRAHGIQNVVVDASSIEVNRRSRRSKPDKLDVQKLLTMLVRFVLGERRLWKVVRVPSAEDEVLRQPHRELIALKEGARSTSTG